MLYGRFGDKMKEKHEKNYNFRTKYFPLRIKVLYLHSKDCYMDLKTNDIRDIYTRFYLKDIE